MEPRAAVQVGRHPREPVVPARVVRPGMAASPPQSGYSAWLDREPVLTKGLTSFVLSTLSSATAQLLTAEPSSAVLLNALNFGVSKVPPYSHFWYPILDNLTTQSLVRVVIDQAFWRPLLTAYTFLMMCLIQGMSLEDIRAKFKNDFVKTVKAGLKIWPAAEVVNQTLVPLKWRSLFKDCVGFGWDMVLVVSTAKKLEKTLEPTSGDANGDGNNEAAGSGGNSDGSSSSSGQNGSDTTTTEEGDTSPVAADAAAAGAEKTQRGNPVLPVTVVVMAIMFWMDKRKRAAVGKRA